MRTQEYKEEKKKEIMEKCFECYCDNGLRNTGIKELGKYCGMTSANLYSYFNNVDELIIQSTAYCMTKVEDDFMELSPKNPQDIMRFISEIPKWSAQKHGKKYRLMYQVYTHPKYVEYGKNFLRALVCDIPNTPNNYLPNSEYLLTYLQVSYLFLFGQQCIMQCLKTNTT